MSEQSLFDVVAVNIRENTVRILALNKTAENARAIVEMAVLRRGVDEEFYAEVPAGKYKGGEVWI